VPDMPVIDALSTPYTPIAMRDLAVISIFYWETAKRVWSTADLIWAISGFVDARKIWGVLAGDDDLAHTPASSALAVG